MSDSKKLLVPDTSIREPQVKRPPVKTPECPACGAKFSLDAITLRCRICGLPDEIAHAGPQVVERWKKQNHVGRTLRECRAAEADKSKTVGGSAGRKKNRHGRKGVKS